mmetsp:Transcript_29572/g.71456  ORF Transcript_29572/g.71456 Transcript_29572/m.71456 type:complete len:176 (+) Transcript_29572:1267-1794(+)
MGLVLDCSTDLERSIQGMVTMIHLNSSVSVVIEGPAVAAANDAVSLEEQASLLYEGAVLVADDNDKDSSPPSCWRYVESLVASSSSYEEKRQDYAGNVDGTSGRRALVPAVVVAAAVPAAVAVLGHCAESGAAVDGRSDRGCTPGADPAVGTRELQQPIAAAAAAAEPSSSLLFR